MDDGEQCTFRDGLRLIIENSWALVLKRSMDSELTCTTSLSNPYVPCKVNKKSLWSYKRRMKTTLTEKLASNRHCDKRVVVNDQIYSYGYYNTERVKLENRNWKILIIAYRVCFNELLEDQVETFSLYDAVSIKYVYNVH